MIKSIRVIGYLAVFSLCLGLLALVFAGGSDILTWNTALSGNWNDATKWTPNNVPDAANEVAVIPTGTVTMNVSPAISALQITSLPGTLNLAGNTLDLLGPDPSFNSGFIIGNAGNAVINGAFENRADGAIRIQAGTSLTFSGPSLVNDGLITVNFNGGAFGTNITFGSTMTVTGGALQILGGVLKGSGTVVAAIVNDNGGSIEPGASVGRMAITGILTNNSQGIVKMEVGGLTAATEHDQITVGGTGANGAASFDGKIEVDLINGFAPVVGDAATLMTYRFLSGRFQEADIPSLTGIRLRLQYLGTSLRLIALDENALGDTNGDGCVDDTDLAAVLAAFGLIGAAMAEDANDDGFVDDIDLAIVLERFGLGC